MVEVGDVAPHRGDDPLALEPTKIGGFAFLTNRQSGVELVYGLAAFNKLADLVVRPLRLRRYGFSAHGIVVAIYFRS